MDIRMIQVSKQYGANQVLKDLNLTFQEGRCHCLMGPSGIGKTTVINLLMGLENPDSGSILGMEGRRVAACFQEDRLIEHLDAISNVKLVCDKRITKEIVEEELNKVGLIDYIDKPVSALSGGMKRRVAIVRALLASSDLVIMDEPFKGLDQELKYRVINYIIEKTKGKTLIIITHDKEDVKRLEANLILLS
ncbi:MAG: ABC transporter ATP-binding protein [Clostridiales bacterium]|nr:ABC transporter ATP-binding protein [Clostridiales bacterium]